MNERRSNRCCRKPASFQPPAALAAGARISSLDGRTQALGREVELTLDAFWGPRPVRLLALCFGRPLPERCLELEQPALCPLCLRGAATTWPTTAARSHNLQGPRAEKTALIWEGEDPANIAPLHLTPSCLPQVCKGANPCWRLGIRKGDLVALYMPMVRKPPNRMLACARNRCAPIRWLFGWLLLAESPCVDPSDRW